MMEGRKPTLALLSTWQEHCGIAHYSYFLKRALDPYFDIEVIPTPRAVFGANSDPAELRAADRYAEEIGRRLEKFDYVNVQYEPGIFGRDMATSSRRLLSILKHAKNIAVTFHWVARRERMSPREHLALWLRGRVAHSIWSAATDGIRNRHWRRIFAFLQAASRKGRVAAIAHTKRDARYLGLMMPDVTVLDTPLTYLDPAFRAAMPELYRTSTLKHVLPDMSNSETRYIGCFGFYQAYKGFETAVEALREMPPNYELLMFSSIHESTLHPNQKEDHYLKSLVSAINDKKKGSLAGRVHFMGAVSDDDLLLGMTLCDAILLPYVNSVHTASGPIALALELDRPVFASRNIQFVELQKYRGPVFELCDIGNASEYAQKIPRMTQERRDRLVHGYRVVDFAPKPKSHDSQTTAKLYLDAMGVSHAVPVERSSPLAEGALDSLVKADSA